MDGGGVQAGVKTWPRNGDTRRMYARTYALNIVATRV